MKFSDATRKKISDKLKGNKNNLGHNLSEETKEKIRIARSKQKPPRPKGVIFSGEHRRKISIGKAGKPNLKVRGEKSNFWKGGVAQKNRTERSNLMNTLEYRIWRRAIFERDNYICVWCGIRGHKLHADHIKPWSQYPELRFAIDNGRTLCIQCHRKTDTYGKSKKI